MLPFIEICIRLRANPTGPSLGKICYEEMTVIENVDHSYFLFWKKQTKKITSYAFANTCLIHHQ